MTTKILQNKLFKIQMAIIELNGSTMETCKFDSDTETIKVWKALNLAVSSLEDARTLIHQNK
ncbi:MAG: hypothetical protein Unbinned3205contig1001_25 [Prokaryotic dsDNA virus sp.]|nr:MAG: hypothetical protein Unbinned3205contig1001_25 [Prokaryotic dsDNA virus sp.]|tara:strand:- start:225 stop:410 length:186 start_codon:yes stop_codon:yes gene_type:complete